VAEADYFSQMSKSLAFALLSFLCAPPARLATHSHEPHARLVEKAECSQEGVHITYNNKTRIEIPTGKKSRSTCQELKVSADKQAAAWVIACTGEALNGNGEGKEPDGSTYQAICASLTGAVAGKTFDIEEIAAFVDHVSFQDKTHQIKYHTAPMHGGGAYVLYDLDSRKQILACDHDDTSPGCVKLGTQ
jgi:hypothetical protein